MFTNLSAKKNPHFDIRGLNHLALVCRDMKKTVDFYQGILGMPLIKTCDLNAGMGQHFFFDAGNGASLAFFWFPDAPEVEKGITVPKTHMGDMGNVTTAVGSMNHVAFDVDAEMLPAYMEKLTKAGIKVSKVLHHDDSPEGHSFTRKHPTLWVSSIYFQDPDGIQLEFAGWARPMRDTDVLHAPATVNDRPAYLERQKTAVA
ncbi:VOC family protein [Scleromatobacter humisilvae]|uniref:VOC family protein n=1 Tax=Scleromatobacter humisilvae TaxID=2897159 RepID=A0A9X1YG53_9BURK|nr:VOC family protein [Scleromatobacter humisilvae]MCK9685709.1 VOC family protein [Scleromatobacter humisilvae]